MADKIVMTTGDIEKTSSTGISFGIIMLVIAYLPYYFTSSLKWWQILLAIFGGFCFYAGITYESNIRKKLDN
jgi:hypothetical protein